MKIKITNYYDVPESDCQGCKYIQQNGCKLLGIWSRKDYNKCEECKKSTVEIKDIE
jgi:hypothetical protein